MLKDSNVKVNERNNFGWTPLYPAARYGHIDLIKLWIASGREMDPGKPGDVYKTNAIAGAKQWKKAEVVTLERYKKNPVETRHALRVELSWYNEAAAKMFAMVVFVSDGLLQSKDTTTRTPAARFFNIATQLPLELQMVLCLRQVGSGKEINSGKESEKAFKELARRLLWASLFTN